MISTCCCCYCILKNNIDKQKVVNSDRMCKQSSGVLKQHDDVLLFLYDFFYHFYGSLKLYRVIENINKKKCNGLVHENGM